MSAAAIDDEKRVSQLALSNVVSHGSRIRPIPESSTSSTPSNSELDVSSIGDSIRREKTRASQAQREYDQRSSRVLEKRVTITYRNLSVLGVGSQAAFGDTVWSVVDPVNNYRQLMHNQGQPRYLLKDFNGQVLAGEMMLVLGRPESGCTTMLKALANKRSSYKVVSGEVHYGNMDHKQAAKYRQQILFSNEEDIHAPTLAVGHTMDFALRNKTPKNKPFGQTVSDFVTEKRDYILKTLGIHHTMQTLVGNEYVRGVSGGERKRVSIAETLAGQSPVSLWDNSTRGLDSSTALDFIRTLRTLADTEGKTVIATLYQAGNGIYDLFDKITVIHAGRQIYYGPRAAARPYFEDMGFVCPPGANVADFLTSVVAPSERVVKPGYENKVPTSVEEFETTYLNSEVGKRALSEIRPVEDFAGDTETLRTAVSQEKNSGLLKGNLKHDPYTVSIWTQITSCTMRQFQIMWGDRITFLTKLVCTIIQALINGSLFYNLSDSSDSIFLRPGALFFGLLYFAMESLAETTNSFRGRPILQRHDDFAFYRPTAAAVALVITDVPIALLNASFFSIVYYWMVGFQADAGKFFIWWIVILLHMLCLISFFRMVGALCRHFGKASFISGCMCTVFMIYAGYLIPFYSMHVWFRWIFYLNPSSYAFEALMANEFGGLTISCKAPQLVPYGVGYDDPSHQTCTVAGSHGTSIDGLAYVKAQYNYSEHHIGRSVGVIIGMWIFFAFLTAVGFEFVNEKGQSSVLLYKRGRKTMITGGSDEEKAGSETVGTNRGRVASSEEEVKIGGATAVFTWKNVNYTVAVPGGQRQLLTNISGFVKPGNLVALMGGSGAGKTTLLDVLAQRKDTGIVEGEIQLDGRPLGISFQRSAGYCEQLDVHEPTATVRESLMFSARLRQPRTVPDAEKIAYVNNIIRLLEMQDIEDALVGSPGTGLSIEQRKRLTIAVELVAKPDIIFLDEPTSGLDGSFAFNIVRFVRTLADSGQAVLCTIHQPSASLFEQFDKILLLEKGGKTVYFGETGRNSKIVLDYFSRHGAPCPPEANPAEHIVNVVQGRALDLGKEKWSDIWLASPEYTATNEELESLKQSCLQQESSVIEDGHGFASPISLQTKLLIQRQSIGLWRNPDYVWNKMALHVYAALFGGFTFWMIGNGTFDLQLRLFAIFNFVFVAPGLINQLQPFFLHNRDIFEAREKKSKTYSWVSFVASQLVSEIPYLILGGTLYFACWYFTAGFPVTARVSGQVYLQMLLYEFLFTSIGQAIATISPSEFFAALLNPLIIGAGLIAFAGVVVPYSSLQPFWRYWLYYLDPFNYLIGGMLTQILWDVDVHCKSSELTSVSPPQNQTCGEYFSDFLSSKAGYIVDPSSRENCEYCAYKTGAEYARTFNLQERWYGWRDTGITALFCVSSYAMVFAVMKLRSKKTKSAKAD